jgi:hypothetical protein
MRSLRALTDRKLLSLYGEIMDELRSRGLVRSANGPGADYAEGLVAKALKLKLNALATAGYDGMNSRGEKFEVKCRRPTVHNRSRQLSAIRRLERKHFDFLVGVLFNPDFSVQRVARIPYSVVKKHAKYVEGTNSWKFILSDSVWSLPGVKDITRDVQKAQRWGSHTP